MTTPYSAPAPAWRKPAAVCAVLLALSGIAYKAFSQHPAAPDVSYVGIDGVKISTSDLRGKVVMVNFWATSCATCIKEMPQMVQTYNKFKTQGLEFVAVAMQGDPPSYVLNYAQTRHLPFRVALDPAGALAKSFGNVAMTPTTFLIDKNGKIIKRYVGEPDFPALEQLLAKTLAS
ncbi:MAG: TlpA disulfide reductase family protein [Pseudomonadota bacterium]